MKTISIHSCGDCAPGVNDAEEQFAEIKKTCSNGSVLLLVRNF